MTPSNLWDLPWILTSSVGIMGEPGYWPSEYIMASRALLLLLTSFFGFKAIFLPFRFVADE